jgi:hypothetical protein
MELLILATAKIIETMSSDAWESAKKAFTAWWRRHRPTQAASVEQELESSHQEIISAESGDEQTRSAIEERWRGRLEALVKAQPEAAEDLASLVEQLTALLMAVEGGAAAVNINSGTAGGHLIQVRDIHGGLQIGDVTHARRPDPPRSAGADGTMPMR